MIKCRIFYVQQWLIKQSDQIIRNPTAVTFNAWKVIIPLAIKEKSGYVHF